MTDARHPERWLTDRRFLRLTGEAFKLYAFGLLWSVSNRTDGFLDEDDLALIPGVARSYVEELVRVGLWRREGAGWRIVDFAATQTSRNELEALDAMRRRDRESKARRRAEKKGAESSTNACPPDTSPDSPPDESTGHQRIGQGQDTLGTAQDSWPDVAAPGAKSWMAGVTAGYDR